MSAATCTHVTTELVAYLDGELADDARRPIATHLSTCLTCRRELERVTAVQGVLGRLAGIEPSPEFTASFWQRMEHEAAPGSAAARPAATRRWVWPALAAAAALALAVPFFRNPPPPPTSTAPRAPADAVAKAPAAVAEKARIAAAPPVAKPTDAPAVASIDDLRLEDLPPELREHPELFLRLPVVRRLETLEHFEAVQQEHGDEGGAG